MSGLTDEFVPLVCPQCGGKIELTKQQYEDNFIVATDKNILYIGVTPVQDGATCKHCDVAFARRTKFVPHADGAAFFATVIGDDNVVVQGTGNIVNTGSGAVARPGGVAAGAGGVAIGGDYDGDIEVGPSGISVRGKK